MPAQVRGRLGAQGEHGGLYERERHGHEEDVAPQFIRAEQPQRRGRERQRRDEACRDAELVREADGAAHAGGRDLGEVARHDGGDHA